MPYYLHGLFALIFAGVVALFIYVDMPLPLAMPVYMLFGGAWAYVRRTWMKDRELLDRADKQIAEMRKRHRIWEAHQQGKVIDVERN